MIVGIGKKKRLTEIMHGTTCPFCNAKDSLVAEGYQLFFILGLPWFPVGKRVDVKCNGCKKFFSWDRLPPQFARPALEMRQRIRPAFWMFAFPGILAILLPIVLVKESITAKENINKIQKAREGDVYTIQVEERLYQKMKVVKISGDSFWFFKSLHEPDKYGSLGSHDVFEGDRVIYTRKELLEKNDHHEIPDISRDVTQ